MPELGGEILWTDELHCAPPNKTLECFDSSKQYQQPLWFQPWLPVGVPGYIQYEPRRVSFKLSRHALLAQQWAVQQHRAAPAVGGSAGHWGLNQPPLQKTGPPLQKLKKGSYPVSSKFLLSKKHFWGNACLEFP